jgi:hypothetical protein
MEGCVLPTTAKLVALSEVTSRFFLTNVGVLCLRFDLGPSPAGDIGFVRLDGSWQAEVVSGATAVRHKRYIEVDASIPHVNAKSMEWKMSELASVGCLVLDQNGLWIVAKHYSQGQGNLWVNVLTGARAWPDNDHASVITSWVIEAKLGDTKTFEIGAHTLPSPGTTFA